MTQTEFYHSTAWRKLSRAFLCSKYYVCERCGKPAEIAHHKKHLNNANINDEKISLNPANLEALCMECHNKEHFGSGGATAAGFMFNENGDILPTERKRGNNQ